MKVWVAGCWACMEDHCIVIFDHEPTEEELTQKFCVGYSECIAVIQKELEDIFNKELGEVFDE